MNNLSPADFNRLGEAEQREVAARLLKIEQSGWKPFWCPDKNCDGNPHVLRKGNGKPRKVRPEALKGPNGEPVAPYYLNTVDNTKRAVIDPSKVHDTDQLLFHVALDPKWAHNHAREDQRLPTWTKPWTLFIMSGRGSGKTRTGVEFVTLSARRGLDGAIIGRRGTELENTHVAEILANAHPEFMPTYLASKDLLVWPEVTLPDGTKVTPKTFLFSAERPENIRSVNVSYLWFDEAAFMDEIETAWMNAGMALRIETPGNPLHTLVTSTPTATKWVMEMEDDPDVEVRRVATYSNKANLSRDYLKKLIKKYENTRIGRQEIYGEVLRDVEGAFWNDDMFRHHRIEDVNEFAAYCESMDARVLAVDPAGSKNKRSDETGIIGVGAQLFDQNGDPLDVTKYSVLLDATIKGSPNEWAAQVYKAAKMMDADRIVVEKNFGGDMVKQVLKDYAQKNPAEATRNGENMFDLVEVVHAVQGKETRAEGTVGKYEQGRVTHITNPSVFGDMSKLEKEQVGWVPKSRGGRLPSPNRIDALVWAMIALESKVRFSATTASRSVLKQVKTVRGPMSPTQPMAPVTVSKIRASLPK